MPPFCHPHNSFSSCSENNFAQACHIHREPTMTFLTGCNEGRKLRHFRAKPYFKRMVFLKKIPLGTCFTLNNTWNKRIRCPIVKGCVIPYKNVSFKKHLGVALSCQKMHQQPSKIAFQCILCTSLKISDALRFKNPDKMVCLMNASAV